VATVLTAPRRAPTPIVDADLADARRLVAQARRTGRARVRLVSLALVVATAVVFCVSVSVGDFPIPLADVVPAIFGHGDPDAHFIVHTLRLPRSLTGLLVGAAFGFSGAVFQTLARNPLASPDFIGITYGASAGAVVVIVVIGGTSAMVSFGALVGAFLTAALMYGLAYRKGVSSYRLVLVGIGVGSVFLSIIEYLLTRADIYDAQRATVWLTGSLNGRGWEHVRPLLVVMVLALPVVLVLARPLRGLQLGDDTAHGIGVSVERSRAGLVLVAVVLTAVATASAGPVNFVSFLAGPLAKRLTRSSGAVLVPSALVGALLLLSSDLVARRAFAPTELPVGVVTGVLGAPFLLWLLARANRVGRGG
jgi:iron complex transport system permease protein